jgi:tetratricopeptide (TPR) repeat protein
MLALLLGVLLASQGQCLPASIARLSQASILAARLDLAGAAALLRDASDCDDAKVNGLYLQGLLDARAAARVGGTAETLAPVRRAIAALEVIAGNQPGPAEIARLTLHAAAAASQTERDEMRLYLESAVQMERLLAAGGDSRKLIVRAMEVAGSLWLAVDRYAEARHAYEEAAGQHGMSLVTTLGLASLSSRLGDVPAACLGYRAFLARWGSGFVEPPEIAEARTYLSRAECRTLPDQP